MAEPRIVIAGSADASRGDYRPPVAIDAARRAAHELGAALARAGNRIVVYHQAFIEGEVVAGYASVPDAPERGIVVRYPLTNPDAARFPEAEQRRALFDFKADAAPHWEASFYRSLREADGIILIGGGTSVVVTGHLALGFRIPLLALGAFGGAARSVWEAIIPDRDLPSEADRDLMAAPGWSADSADRCVRCLRDQAARHSRELPAQKAAATRERWRRQLRYALVGGLALLSMGVLLSAFLIDAHQLRAFLVLLFFGPCVAGVSGAMTRMVWSEDSAATPTLRTGALGLVAGAISAALYVVAQLAAKPDLLRITQSQPDLPVTLIYFAVVTGWIAGFTSDLVFSKLAKTEVTKTKIIP